MNTIWIVLIAILILAGIVFGVVFFLIRGIGDKIDKWLGIYVYDEEDN